MALGDFGGHCTALTSMSLESCHSMKVDFAGMQVTENMPLTMKILLCA